LSIKLLVKIQVLCYFHLIVVQYSALRIYGTLVLFLLPKMRKKMYMFLDISPNAKCGMCHTVISAPKENWYKSVFWATDIWFKSYD
jgi:hypothetical protein